VKPLLSLLLLSFLGCAPPAQAPTNDVARHEVPNESFAACADKTAGASCVVRISDVEAVGACAPAEQFSSTDRRLFCNGEGG
jgi:hypothetical protein